MEWTVSETADKGSQFRSRTGRLAYPVDDTLHGHAHRGLHPARQVADLLKRQVHVKLQQTADMELNGLQDGQIEETHGEAVIRLVKERLQLVPV